MTCQIPESIIQKIMLYNSHPIVDILNNSDKFKERRRHIEIFNNDKAGIRCFECDDVIDWLHKDHLCVLCRRFVDAENEQENYYNGGSDADYEELEELRLYG